MESNEDSIKILEMRIRQQMNVSLQKNMKPENVKYYMPSAELSKPVMPISDVPKPVTPLPSVPKPVMPISDVPESVSQAAEVNPPADAEYIDRAVGVLPMPEFEHIEIPESKESQHAKALIGYETSRSLDRNGTFRMEDMHFLDAKG